MKGPNTNKIKSLFNSIAGDYDKLNHILSLGIDRAWRRRAIKYVSGPSVLDVACGTGDFAIAVARRVSGASVTGVDLSEGMLSVMEMKVSSLGLSSSISAEVGNCEELRFEDSSFDSVTIGFGIRNFEHREKALGEILRVLRPGGRLIILELSVPSCRVIAWLYKLYFLKVLPWIGGIVSGDTAAYKYLPASVLAFPPASEWVATMKSCGFSSVFHKAYTLGICRLYVGVK